VSGRVEPTLDSTAVTYSTLQSNTTDRVDVEFGGDASGVVDVRCFRGGEPLVGPAAPAVVDHYRLDVPNTSAGTPATVSLAVRPSRVSRVGVSPDRLVVKRWGRGGWRAVDTTVERTDGAVVVTAELPRLPRYLAVSTPAAVSEGDGPTPTPTERPPAATATPPPTAPPATPADRVTVTPPPTDGGGIADVVLPVLAVLVAAAALAVGWVVATRSAARYYEEWR
jgi:hypothetical protein